AGGRRREGRCQVSTTTKPTPKPKPSLHQQVRRDPAALQLFRISQPCTRLQARLESFLAEHQDGCRCVLCRYVARYCSSAFWRQLNALSVTMWTLEGLLETERPIVERELRRRHRVDVEVGGVLVEAK